MPDSTEELSEEAEAQLEPSSEKGADRKRITVTLRKTDRDRLDRIVDETHLPPNDAVRQALATEAFVLRALSEGSKVLIETRDGRTREVEFVYS